MRIHLILIYYYNPLLSPQTYQKAVQELVSEPSKQANTQVQPVIEHLGICDELTAHLSQAVPVPTTLVDGTSIQNESHHEHTLVGQLQREGEREAGRD